MTNSPEPRLLRDRDEARELVRFLQRCQNSANGAGVYHIGDIWWHLAFHNPQGVAVWEDGTGEIVGFAWLEPPDGVLMHIRPDLRGDGALERAMMAWAVAAQPSAETSIRAFDSDAATTVAWLLANGFVRGEFAMVVHRRDMDEPIAPSVVPPGFTLRHVLPHEFQERVDAHRDAFHPSKFTLDAYLLARDAPDYDPELDIVAVAPDGTIAAYCIAWYDAANHIGYFEPVGTRAAFRGHRLGQAVLNEALRRLQARGARKAVVATGMSNAAARRLYQSVGFHEIDMERAYSRKN